MKNLPLSLSFVVPAFAIALICLMIYFPSLKGDFVYDDMETIVNNRYIKDIKFVPDYFNPANKEMWSFHPGQRQLYRPLLLTTFALNYAFSGLNPFSYHLVNLLLHLANALLLQRLFRLFSQLPGIADSEEERNRIRIGAWFAAFLFAVHPLQTEAVSYIVSRSSVLATLLILGALIAFIKSLTPPSNRQRGYLRLIGLFLFSLSLLTKEIAIVLPLLVVLVAFLGIENRLIRVKVRTVTIICLPYFLILALYLVPRILLFGKASLASKLSGLLVYFATSSKAAFIYLKLTLWPFGQTVDHYLPLIQDVVHPKAFLAPVGLIALFAVLVFVVRPRSKILFLSGAWWFVALLPNLFLPTLEAISEHSAYFPSGGLFGAAGYILVWAWHKAGGGANWTARLAGIGLFAALVMQLGFLTASRNLVWRSSTALWSDAVKKAPTKIRPRINLGEAYLLSGRIGAAAYSFHEALSLDPKNVKALNNLGIYNAMKGRVGKAASFFDRALTLEPENWEVRNNRGRLLLDQQRYPEAVAELKIAARLKPESASVWNNLGQALVWNGNQEAGCKGLVRAMEMDPDNMHGRHLFLTLCRNANHRLQERGTAKRDSE